MFKVKGMSCGHCVKAVTDAVFALGGIERVDVNLKAGTVLVEHDPGESSAGAIKAAIEEEGYKVA